MYQTEKSEEYVAKSECLATILQRTVVENWNVVIHYHEDPKFKTGLFEMEVIAGIVRPYAANVIVDNIFWKVNQIVRRNLILTDIINHQSNTNTVEKEDQYITINACYV